MDITSEGRVLFASEELRSEISGIDPATGKLRTGLAWFDGTAVTDLLPDGTAMLGYEWGGPAGPLYMAIYRKLDGSAPVRLGDGAMVKFSPDRTIAAAGVETDPPYIALYPIGPGEVRKFPLPDVISLSVLTWFPDGKHILIGGAKKGEALRSYRIDLETGNLQVCGPAGFLGVAIANDGKRIAGFDETGKSVIFNTETQRLREIPGITQDSSSELESKVEQLGELWTDDGKALIVNKSTLFGGEIYRLDLETGKSTLLQKFELSDKAGSLFRLRVLYAPKTILMCIVSAVFSPNCTLSMGW
ncbi:MAG: hypothetical protein M3N12_01445, partial [Verrucomicrobiota bacterium]|nr:hypothetical protein [Verrucomicrobiota bacterium]